MAKGTETEVKSAVRTLAVLELFDALQRPLGAGEIKQRLNLPHSSASMLLRSMLGRGYLTYDARERTYMVTLRVSFLGSWLERSGGQGAALRDLVEDVADRTGELVAVARQVGNSAQYVLVRRHSYDVPYTVAQGATFPLARCTSGLALMAPMADPDITRIAIRTNADQPDSGAAISPRQLVGQVDDVRRRGHAYSEGLVNPGSGAIAMLLPRRAASGTLALVVGGTCTRLAARSDRYVGVMQDRIAAHLAAECRPGA